MTRTLTTPPPHGERRCFLRGCRLPECIAADKRYIKRLRLDRERGVRRRLDAQPAAERIQTLRDAGWTQAQIARAAGLSHTVIRTVAAGRVADVTRKTAVAILSVQPGPPPQDLRDVDGTGSTRRIRALLAFGYTAVALADELGLAESAVGNIARGRAQVRAVTAETIATAYRRLSATPGPSNRSRILAARNGWHGPLAWGEDIDDPAAQPDTGQEDGLPSEGLRPDVEHLLRFGESTAAVRARTGASASYIREVANDIAGRPRIRTASDMRKAA